MTDRKAATDRMEKIVSLCKRRGFIFQSSEIYGGINGFWDYGPLGAELKRNVKELWWKSMTKLREDVVGLEASIIMHPAIWKASGHVDTFADPMVDCLLTKKRFRADQIEPQSGTVYHYSGVQDDSYNYFLHSKEFKDAIPGWEDAVAQHGQERPSAALQELVVNHLRASDDSAKQKLGSDFLRASGMERMLPIAYAVLLPPGKPPEYAQKIATLFYQQRGYPHPKLLGQRTEKIENSTRFNPENGSLLSEPRQFNLMFKTHAGPVDVPALPSFDFEDGIDIEGLKKWEEDFEGWQSEAVYLRPETAQAIFAQFKNVLDVSRQKVPFGISQIGKAFRNEINPRNFTFRSREFEQMELEFFIKPDEIIEKQTGSVAKLAGDGHPGEPQPNWGWELWHRYWVEERMNWYESIGLPRTTLEMFSQPKKELAHYARACVDILFKFPFGTQELEGIAARGNFDLTQHQTHSGKSMEYFDETVKEKYIPHVIEPSAGVDRLLLALICNAYDEEEVTDEKGNKETRVVMRFHPRVAPITVGVFPLLKNKPELVKKAQEVRDLLRPHMNVFYDDAGAIGRRYRRQDEAGTPFGVTIDFDTLGEKGPEAKDTVTLRDRDSMKQERVAISELLPRLLAAVR